MKRIYKVSLFLLAIVFCGCFEDKGNYDLRDINEIVIDEFEKSSYNFTMGDTINFKPILTFSSGVATNEENLSYRWFLREERTNKVYENPDWNKKDFSWIADLMMRGYLIFEITDKRNDMVYTHQTSCNISSEYYESGFMVLSEKEDKSVLSFIKFVEMKLENGHQKISKMKIYEDVYALNNDGNLLGEGPIGMQEHFCDGGNAVIGQFLIFQRSGCVDVSGLTYEKEMSLEQAFDGGVIPANSVFTNGALMGVVDVLADEEGKLYNRIKSRKDLFHSEYFIQEPLKFEGEVLTDCRVIRGTFNGSYFSLIYDGKYKRFLIILDGGTSYESIFKDAGKIIAVPAQQLADTPEGFVPLTNLGDYELLDVQYNRPDYGFGYVLILKDKDGAIYEQEFMLKYRNGNLTVSKCVINPIPSLPGTPDLVCICPYVDNEPTIFFALENKLYLFDRANPKDPVKLYYTFDAKIAAMHNENYMSRLLGVGLEDGNFFILDGVNAKNNTDVSKRVLYKLPEDVRFGRIVDTKYKVMRGNGWEVF